jgi:serpin B
MKDDQVVSGYVRFGLNLFSEIFNAGPEENIFISPTSVALALAMTYGGAAGATEEAMASVLGFAGLDREEVRRANASWLESLGQLDPQIRLEMANSLWLREGIAFKPDFVKTSQGLFQAEVAELDFSRPDAVKTINDWVKRATHKRIREIVDRIDPLSILFLINAVYFKGSWTSRFDLSRTNNLPFQCSAGRSKNVPMMSQKRKFEYLEGDAFQAVKLPYGNRSISLVVVLPAKDSSLKALVQTLDLETWTQWRSRFETREGEVVLPKFKIEYEKSLREPLKRLGMGVAFDREKADFGRMCETPPPVYIDEVRHKSCVEVNEEGTEAAAASSFEARCFDASFPLPAFRLVVDRPFFFVIQDERTGLLLFMGSITDPQPEK